MTFGKKGASGPTGSDPSAPIEPRTKLIPDELWTGSTGKMLRAIGKSPDDESNLLPTRESVNARIALEKKALEARTASVNQSVREVVADGEVKPFFLYPASCWNGELGHFMIFRLGFTPYEDWNIAYLPADARTAMAIKTVPHPNADIGPFTEIAERAVRMAKDMLDNALKITWQTGDYRRFHELMLGVKRELKLVAASFRKDLDDMWPAWEAKVLVALKERMQPAEESAEPATSPQPSLH